MKRLSSLCIVALCGIVLITSACGNTSAKNRTASNASISTAVSSENTKKLSDIDTFISEINAAEGIHLEYVEDFVPSDKNSGHYKTEFRLTAYANALGKSYRYGDTTVDIIIKSSGSIDRIYMDRASYEQCENMIRYASPLLDPTVTEADIQKTIDYIAEHKIVNGYHYAKLGLLMLGNGDGYDFMLG